MRQSQFQITQTHLNNLLPHHHNGKHGAISSVSCQSITSYCKFLEKHIRNDGIQLIPQVLELQNTIYSDPFIRMCLQGSLDSLHQRYITAQQKPPLFGYTIKEVLVAINAVAVNPPVYENKEIIGVPFAILLFGLMNSRFGQDFFANPKINEHLKKIFDAYGDMLRSPISREVLDAQNNGWLSSDKVNYQDFIHDPSDTKYFGFTCWNDWFSRKLAPDARPVDSDPDVIVHSSDSYCLENPRQPVKNVKAISSFWLKDDNYSLFDMFGVAKMGPQIQSIVEECFVGGTVYQAFLSPWCYHRWHAPVSGKVIKCYSLPGTYMLMNPMSDLTNQGLQNYVATQPQLTSFSTRYVFIIDTLRPDIGKIAVIQVGMTEVSSCISIVKQNDMITKGQQLGRFQFGGSSYAIIFDKQVANRLEFTNSIYQKQDGEPILQKVNSFLCKIQTNYN